MSPDVLARLAREAEAPEGIAVRVSGPEMKRLLEERAAALWWLRTVLPWADAWWRMGEARGGAMPSMRNALREAAAAVLRSDE